MLLRENIETARWAPRNALNRQADGVRDLGRNCRFRRQVA